MSGPAFDGIRDDVWHLLLNLHAYAEKAKRVLECSPTRYEMAWEIIALNAMAENIIIRIARLADKRKDVRSIKNLMKKVEPHQYPNAESLASSFLTASEEAVNHRHDMLAHMKTNNQSSYPLEPLPRSVLRATEILLNLLDHINGQQITYHFSPGSQERNVDLRSSLAKGETITV